VKRFVYSIYSFSLIATLAFATPYATYNADINQQPADPTTQGWSILGSLHQGVDDNGVLGWELNDNTTGDANPTMSRDYGAANVPQAGDPWSFSVNARVLYGNGAATNVIMWSDGSVRYLFFVYEDNSGNFDLLYFDTKGDAQTYQDVAVNDDDYHDWAIEHDGTDAKVTYDGVDVVALGTISSGGFARGVYVGGGSSGGVGALYVTRATFDATLAGGSATTTLGRVFTDHMVLLRDQSVAIYGQDSVNPGTQSIEVSFAGQTKTTTTDAEGNWQVTLDPMAANATGRVLVVTGSSVVTIGDVLVGEVWLAAGQSNMNHTISTSLSVNTPDASKYPLIRMCNWEGTVGTGSSTVYGPNDFANLTPGNFYNGTWQVLDASTVLAQSAVAYYFAQNLVSDLNVPVGIVDISYGGTSTEAYISPESCLADPHLKEAFERPHLARNLGQWTGPRLFKNVYNNNTSNYSHPDPTLPHPHPYAPGFLFYTGMSHLTDFTFRGAIWYQGESNAEFTTDKYQINGNRLSDYQTFVMKTMIEDWRVAFGRPDFPVYMVQLPRINASNRVLWPFYREAQSRVARELAQVELATIMEYGVDSSNVHPNQKEPVGERLAAIARAKLYGQTIVYSGPTYRSHTVSGDKLVLEFEHVGGGLVDEDGGALRNFQIAGLDRQFFDATALIVGDTIEVSAPSVPEPVAVRHAWEMNADVDLYNAEGFSASSFRTDNWIAAPGRTLRVACVGDSITWGSGISDPADFYPAQLGNLLGTTNFEVRNFGNPGYGIYRVSKRYDTTTEYTGALAWSPDIVICNLGINDITDWGSYTQAQFETEFFQLIDAFITSGSTPLFIQWSPLAPIYPGQTFYGDPDVGILNDWIREAAASTNAVLLDMETALLGRPEWFPDNLHPNADGAREIAESTFCLLDSIGDMDAAPSISEIVAVNASGIQDEDGDFSDWIELSNTGSGGLCLSGTFLMDSISDGTVWQFPSSTVIEPGKSLLVFASGKDRAVNAEELHSNFMLPDTGGHLYLVADDGIRILDALVNFPAQHADISYGRTAEASSPLVGAGPSLRYLVPVDGSLGSTWTESNFDDSAWTSAATGLGYDADLLTFDGSAIWDGGLLNGWSEDNASGTVKTLDGSVLRYNHSGSGAASVLKGTDAILGGGSTTWDEINDGDWTFEITLKINDSPNGFLLWLGTDTSRIYVNLLNDRTTDYLSNTFTVLHTNNDGAFHTFRISHDSAAAKYHVWRDAVLLTPVGGVGYDSTTGDSRLLFGDFTSGTFGDDFDVEIASVAFTGTLYGGLVQTDLETEMKDVHPSLYLRAPIELNIDPSQLTALNLNVRYDDGFVAYLNGTEIVRRNAPEGQVWNSSATTGRADVDSLSAETIDLSSSIHLLHQGSNVLAIHAMNETFDADRFLIRPDLLLFSPSETRFFEQPTPGAVNGGRETGSKPFAMWKSVNGVLSDHEDVDKDGLSAELEFFLGTSPNSASSGDWPRPRIVETAGDQYFCVRFRMANGIQGLDFSLKYSDDLEVAAEEWSTELSPVLIASVNNGDGSSTYDYRLSTSIDNKPQQFVRVAYLYNE
jgi:sialate O-acetylesterase